MNVIYGAKVTYDICYGRAVNRVELKSCRHRRAIRNCAYPYRCGARGMVAARKRVSPLHPACGLSSMAGNVIYDIYGGHGAAARLERCQHLRAIEDWAHPYRCGACGTACPGFRGRCARTRGFPPFGLQASSMSSMRETASMRKHHLWLKASGMPARARALHLWERTSSMRARSSMQNAVRTWKRATVCK